MRERTPGIATSWPLALLLTAMLLPGCGTADTSGYRTINQDLPDKSPTGQVSAKPAEQTNDPASPDVQPIEDVATDLPVSALRPVNVVDGASVSNLLKSAPQPDPASNPQVDANGVVTSPATSNKPRVTQLLIPEKSFTRDGPTKASRVSFDDLDLLKVLNLEPVTENAVELMPSWLKDLNGQRIRIRGFMYPTFEAEGIERFVLARDNQICCFGRDPKIYDLVQVDLRAGKTTSYIPATRAFDVVGKFKIEMVAEDGKPFGLYTIEDAEIIDR